MTSFKFQHLSRLVQLMNAVSLDLVCSGEGLVAAVCTDRRKSSQSVRIWVQNTSKMSPPEHTSKACDALRVTDADIIIPMDRKLSSLCVQQIMSSDSESGVLSIVVLCSVECSLERYYLLYSTHERRVVHTDLLEADTEAPIDNIVTNTSSTLIVTFNKLPNSRRQGSVVLWSAKLRKLRTLEAHSGLGPTSNKLAGLMFAGESEQYVAACYASGCVVGWDAITGDVIFTFSTLGTSLTNSPSLPCALATLPSDAAGLALCVGCEDGVVKYYDLLPSRGSGTEEVRFDHRERLSIDLKRTLRFAGMAGRSEDGAARDLVLSPLRLYTHCGVYLCEELCVVVPSGLVLLGVKDGKLIRAVSLDELLVNSISAATCITSYATPIVDTYCGQTDTPVLQVAMLTAFSDCVHVFTHITNTSTTATTNTKTNTNNTTTTNTTTNNTINTNTYTNTNTNTNTTHTLPLQPNTIPAMAELSLEGADEAQLRAQRRQEMKHTKMGSSVYEDESIPLSYFMHPSMLHNDDDCDDSISGSTKVYKSLLVDTPTRNINSTNTTTSNNKQTKTTSGIATRPRAASVSTKLDQPITFQRKMKSSGYGQIPTDLYEKKKYFEAQDKLKKQRIAAQTLQRSLSAGGSGMNSSSGSGGSGGSGGSSCGGGSVGPRIRSYPIDCAPMSLHQTQHDITPCSIVSTSASATTTHTNTRTTSGHAIHHIAYSGDGSLLGVASADCAVVVVKLPVSKYGGEAVVSYLGHTSRVNNVCFTHSRYTYNNCGGATNTTTSTTRATRTLPQYSQQHYQLLTSSADGSARMWRYGSSDSAAVVFTHTKHSLDGTALSALGSGSVGNSGAFIGNTKRTSVSSIKNMVSGNVGVGTYSGGSGSGKGTNTNNTSAKDTRNRPFGEAVSHASYFYMDKFAVMSVKAGVYMYQYNVYSEDANDDLKRTLATGTYQLATRWDLSPLAQSVCALNCVNSAQSPLIFASTTDKYLNVLDGSTGGIARVVESPHTRNIHCIALPRPSVHTALSPDAYNCFLTSAIDNNIYLWDLRAPNPVSRYYAHVNKREQVMCDISPCMRYVATGSEDKSAVIYDIRAGKVLSKLTGHRDVVKCVAFNPLFPQLATGSYDGTVKFYADAEFASHGGF